MDMRYETALSNAVNAWSQNRVTDPITMQNLKRNAQHERSETKRFPTVQASSSDLSQPALAKYGNLGTKLNIFA